MSGPCVATEIRGLENLNTSNVTSMAGMFFYDTKVASINVSSFDTSNVTSMLQMFDYTSATEIRGLENFNTSNVTNMEAMFYYSKATSLDLSSFDTSKVTNMKRMFDYSKATTGYAKTCEDAAKFNASSSKTAGLTFTVKDTTC